LAVLSSGAGLKRSFINAFAITLLLAPAADAGAAEESASASITVHVHFASRTSLTVSTEVLQFTVGNITETATATLDYSAAARTDAGAAVTLSFEVLDDPRGPGAAIVSSINDEAGTTIDVAASTPAVSRQWVGSGIRTGRMTFALRARKPGQYMVPIRFTLTAP
jgi:hypothetical protein